MSLSEVTGPIEKCDNRLYDEETFLNRSRSKFQARQEGRGEMCTTSVSSLGHDGARAGRVTGFGVWGSIPLYFKFMPVAIVTLGIASGNYPIPVAHVYSYLPSSSTFVKR